MYGACGCVEEAKAVFEGIHGRNVFSWNLMLLAYTQNGYFLGVRKAFDQMPSWDVVSWSTLVTFFCQTGDIHSAKNAFDCTPQKELLSWNTLLAANARNGQIQDVQEIFVRMPAHSLASWNSIITLVSDSANAKYASYIFAAMPSRDEISWNSMLSVYTQAGHIDSAKELFDFFPAWNLRAWNAMITAYAQIPACSHDSRLIFESSPQRDSVSWNGLIRALAYDHVARQAVFDAMPQRDVVSWTSMVQASLDQGLFDPARELFDAMPSKNVVTWTMVVTAFAEELLDRAEWIFYRMPQHNLVTWNVMLAGFAQNGKVDNAKLMFESLPARDTVSWNTMMSSYNATGGFLEESRDLFFRIPRRDVVSWNLILVALVLNDDLPGSRTVFDLMPRRDVVSWKILIQAYAQEGDMDRARSLLESGIYALGSSSGLTWSILLRGYSSNGLSIEAFELLKRMDLEGVKLVSSSYTALLDACSGPVFLELGKKTHARVLFSGLDKDLCVVSSLIVMYGKCGSLHDAMTTYSRLDRPDVVCSNSMITAYIHSNRMAEARGIVESMVDPSVESWNILLHGYGQNGNLEEAKLLFDKLPERDAMSWSSILCAYVAAGLGAEALMIFREMDLEGFRPGTKSLVAVLEACGSLLGDLAHCKIVHSSIAEAGLDRLKGVETSIISMYSRCGSLRVAREIFDKRPQELRARWSSMIAGYAQNGHAREALDLFKQMLLDGVEPNSITLVSIISACSHTGALGDGLRCFGSLRQDFNIVASDDIYKCVVDVLGRAGMLSEAEEFISAMMPFEADSCTWMSLLGSCRSHGDVRRGQKIAAMEFEAWSPTSSTFVLLSNLCVAGKSL
ncbi:pentatricopeptide repeat-containing protein At1g62260, mitochondrial [Selaginella moellendorffii]|nr:pentatricopeptide repeat-containing protein At1g62260, mitochondrial [Selaginella moellendorffii]|eukprot:XP_002975622.2 pentatricopeptide repeat-containing protein At1g62260, mitochondrial [Selaginella moellendorffii]